MATKQPLFLPEGSVRAILALAFIGATIVGFFVKKTLDPTFMGMSGMIIGYYFAKRGADKAQ